MKLYHGSDIQGLTELRSEFSSEDNFEGSALYFTDRLSVAKEYALNKGSVYEIEILDPVLDFSSKELVESFLKPILKTLDIDIDLLEYLDGATHHILNHSGKNGIWCFGEDVSDILKFEPKYKNIPDLKEKSKKLLLLVDQKVKEFNLWKIYDSGNQEGSIFIYNKPSIKVIKEHKLS